MAEVYCQVGPNSRAQRARLDMFEQVFSEPFYDTLRTKEQLGYSVHCSTRLTHGILGFAFVVISGERTDRHLGSSAMVSATRDAARTCLYDCLWTPSSIWLVSCSCNML